MKTATIVTRVVLGLIFIFADLNMFLGVFPMPTPAPPGAEFMGALAATGYFIPFLKGVEFIAALMLVFNLYVPLALVVLAPIVVNIFLFHMFLDLAGMPLAIVMVALMAFLGYAYRHNFAAVLQRKAHPLSQKVTIRREGREKERKTTLRPAEQH